MVLGEREIMRNFYYLYLKITITVLFKIEILYGTAKDNFTLALVFVFLCVSSNNPGNFTSRLIVTDSIHNNKLLEILRNISILFYRVTISVISYQVREVKEESMKCQFYKLKCFSKYSVICEH